MNHINKHYKTKLRCYLDNLEAYPNIEGKMTMQFLSLQRLAINEGLPAPKPFAKEIKAIINTL